MGLNRSSSYNFNVVIKISKIKIISSTLLSVGYCLEVKEVLTESSKASQSQVV